MMRVCLMDLLLTCRPLQFVRLNDQAHLPGRCKSLMSCETVMRPRAGVAPRFGGDPGTDRSSSAVHAHRLKQSFISSSAPGAEEAGFWPVTSLPSTWT